MAPKIVPKSTLGRPRAPPGSDLVFGPLLGTISAPIGAPSWLPWGLDFGVDFDVIFGNASEATLEGPGANSGAIRYLLLT